MLNVNHWIVGLIMEHKAEQITFKGKKPSKAQIIAKVKPLTILGIDLIEVYWGENGFSLDRSNNGTWTGFGWIKDIPAESIADELNKTAKLNKFIANHVIFLRG
jgi:hypothetical protein